MNLASPRTLRPMSQAEPIDSTAMPLEPAGFWIRALARILDQGILAVAAIAVGVFLVFVAYFIEGATGRSAEDMIKVIESAKISDWISGFLAMVAYHTVFECVAGSTIGKRMLGLQVISFDDGGPIRFMQAFLRSIAFAADAFLFGAVAASTMSDSPEKQRVGDRWGDTRVVRRHSLPTSALPSTMQFFAGFVAAFQTAVVVLAIVHGIDFLVRM